MSDSRLARILGALCVATAFTGCAAGETDNEPFTPSHDAALDAADDAVEAGTDATSDVVADAEPDAGLDAQPDAELDAEPDAALDAALDAEPDAELDAEPDALVDAPDDSPDADAGEDADAGCPTGYTGPGCEQCDVGFVACESECIDSCSACPGFARDCDGTCVADCKTCPNAPVACEDACIPDCSTCAGEELDCNGLCVTECAGVCPNASYECEGQCVASCASCSGYQATCEATHECLNGCTACSGSCTECPGGYHACPTGCHIDVADVPTLGCMYTCDDQPCPVPSYGQSVCTNGGCDFTCDTASGFQKSGNECVCDTANGFVVEPNLHICVCQSGMKGCGTFCADLTDPAHGCSSPYCTACPTPNHAVTTSCNAAGGCEFTCDASNGYIKNTAGTACVCPFGMLDDGTSCHCPVNQKECNGTCVSTLIPANGCEGASCIPCTLPAHAAATDCSGPGGTCGFVCDTSNGYIVNATGDDCTCGPGLTDYGTYCGCPGGEKICAGSCVSISSPNTGCAGASCAPCSEPAHAVADCSGAGGICGFSCDASGHWVVSGAQCACASGWKDCGGNSCVDATDPTNGCFDVACSACPVPEHAIAANCGGTGGTCSFTCDATGHWVAIGDQCVCNSGWKDCGGASCLDATTPTNGCSDASCSACPLPAHATAANCNGTGGTCDFVCDSAGHWIKAGGQCVCESGYTDQGGVCVPACPGSTYGSSCYWYVSNASSWDAAQSTCAASGGHLASVADSLENSFVRGLTSSNFWIGLRDYSTINQSVDVADDCTNNVWLSGNGGTYLGNTDGWDDGDPCGIPSDVDDIFGLSVTVPAVYVFSTANSGFDTVLGLYNRINDTSDYTTCVGTSLECNDDSGPGTRSLIVRYLGAGDYTLMMDGYTDSWGDYQLDVRRFDFVDATAHTWANWAAEEPSNSSSAEDCTEVNTTSGAWNDLSCATARAFVCERSL